MNISPYYSYNLSSISSMYNLLGSSSTSSTSNNSLSSLYDLYNQYGVNSSSSSISSSTSELLMNFTDYNKDLKASATALETAARKSNYASAYTSDNRNVATVQSGSKAYSDSSIELEVEQAATTQVNTSKTLNSTEKNNLSTEKNNFTIETNGESYHFSVQVNSTSTNKEVLDEVASQINKSGLGISATVTEKDGKSSIALTSKEGRQNAFTLKDKSGSLVERLGLNTASQSASDASYKVNGASYTSSSNSVTLDNKVAVTLKGAGKATIGAGKNVDTAYEAAKQFVADYNKTLDLLSNSSDQTTKTKALTQSLSGVGKTNKYSLNDIGIDVTSSGKLSIDEKRFTEAFAKDSANTGKVLDKVATSAEQSANRALNTSKSTLVSSGTSQEDYYSAILSMSKNTSMMSNYYYSMASLGLFMNASI